MNQSDMIPGSRVRIVQDVELYPIGTYPAGLTGTVEAGTGDGDSAPFCDVRLDRTFPELAEWDNCLRVWGPNVPECTAEDFEPA